MLVLTRNCGDTIHIGPDVVVTIVSTCGGRVAVGIVAPKSVEILRGELIKKGGSNASDDTKSEAQ